MTFRLNSRCLDILDLLAAAERPLAAVDIAKQLNISSRMVRTSLTSAEQCLQESHIILKKVRGKGFSLVGSEEAKINLARMVREYNQPLTWISPTERLFVILLSLFFTDKPIQIKQLQQTLNLSRTTTIRLMDSTKKWLVDNHLVLIHRPNYGYMIAGDEVGWREAVINLLQESAGDARLLALFRGIRTVVDITFRTKTGLEEELQKVWIRLDIPLIKILISPIEHEFEGTLSDQEYINFFIYLAIAIYRNRIGKRISTFPEISKRPFSSQRLSEAQKIYAQVHEQFGILLPETEIAWIALQIPDTNPVGSTSNIKVDEDSSIKILINQILAQASLSLHPSLSVDMDLIRNLTVHIESILDPRRQGQTSKNPLLQEVKNRYSYIYAVACQSSLVLSDRLGRKLTEAEIGYIAICFIASMERLRLLERLTKKVMVVCSAGVVTAWLLVSRLRAEFPDIEVVEIISALELENRKYFEGIDYIVSTIPLRIKNIPSIQVNPLLGLDDCKALKEFFEKKGNISSENKLTHLSTTHLSELITLKSIELDVVAENWQEVVEKAGVRLVEAGDIEAHFIQAMKNIILEFGPYMVIWPGAVLLHASPSGVRRLCMELITLRKPVYFGHPENDPVQIAIVLGAKDSSSHITALLELNRLMQDETARSAIRNTSLKSVVLHWVSRFSNSTEL